MWFLHLLMLMLSAVVVEPSPRTSDQREDYKSLRHSLSQVNDDFVDTLNKLYDKVPHTFRDAGDVQKANFAVLAQFCSKFLQLYNEYRGVKKRYERAYDAALSFVEENRNVHPVEAAAPFGRMLDYLRAVLDHRVANVQRVCNAAQSEDQCRIHLNVADKEASRLCPGYLLHATLHDKVLKFFLQDRDNLREVVDTAFVNRLQVEQFLLDSRQRFRKTLLNLAAVYDNLVTGKFECINDGLF